MRLACCFVICLMQIISSAKADEGKYTVIAPGTIYSKGKYTAAVAVHHITQPCQIRVGITGPSYNETKQVELSSNEIENVEFDLPTLERGTYNLTAEGVNCMGNFKNSTRLNFGQFHINIKIQTDKGLYKPGDDINFRVLFIGSDLKPVEPESGIVIFLEDAKRNRVKEIRDFKTVKGVYTGKFKLSEFPAFGGWYLSVNKENQYENRAYFDVEKYVLPKYSVKVEATEAVSVKDGDMQVVVRASYTYGKPLDGKATVVLTLDSGLYYYSAIAESSENPKTYPVIIRTTDMVNGKAKFDLNVKEYDAYLLSKEQISFINIVATAEEKFTGVKINATASTTLYPYRYIMRCVSGESCYNFEADKENDVLFQITYIDDSNVKDTKSTIELIYTEVLSKHRWWPDHGETTVEPPISKNNVISYKGHMNETGFVNFKVSLPELTDHEGYSHYYRVQMKYLDEQREIQNTYQRREPRGIATEPEEPKEYFKVHHSRDAELSANEPQQVTIESSQPLPYLDYNVVARGNILKSERIDLPDKPKVYNITLTPELSWVPRFNIYVYYVDDNGEYHYAEEGIGLNFELPNEIDVSAATQVKPGEEVALKIKTSPNSFVGLMAVDQSVLLLRQNNDLNYNELRWILESHSSYTSYQGGYSYYPGTLSGCVTLTNANYFYNWTKPNYAAVPVSHRYSTGFAHKTAHVADSESQVYGAAGFAAISSNVGATSGENSVQVRKNFAETWLFDDIENTETADFTWSKKIPETITSWVLTAFSLNPEKGLSVTKDATKITTFLPFFISIRLPYSVKRGEVINVPALLFNYLDKALDVQVTLDNSDEEYEFTEFDNEVITENKRSKNVRVPANGTAGISFLLKPKTIGNVLLKFTAISAVAADAIHKSMKVVPEGITQYANRAYFVNLKKEPEIKTSFALELPKDFVPDSEHVEVGVVGDILGPVLNNLDNLVRLPRGCGEQTMSTLLPNYLVLKYLKNGNRLTDTLQTKLLYNLEAGYQNMLNYRHPDGSFSSFGPAQDKEEHRNGSTWLTAYVVRSLQQIKEYVSVNDEIIEKGLSYISQQQAANGTFTEKGDYFYASQRNHITLTGAAILAFLENTTYADKYSQKLTKGLDFISKNIDETDSLYAKAIGAYVLNKAKHEVAKEKLAKLKTLAKTDSDRMWWSPERRQFGNRWWYYVYSHDVETTSYALLTLLDQNSTKVDDVLPVIKWLVAQRNSYGGFASTQDTVVGLTALMKFADFADYEPAKMNVDIESKDKMETITLNDDNSLLYQTVELPPATKSIQFTAKGTGSALVQIAYQYNIFEKEPQPSFTIKTTKIDNNKKSSSRLDMLVCVNYVGEGEASNMALLEITTPSGYVIEDESLTEIKSLKRVSNTELKNSGSLLVVYFDHLYKNDETCLMIEALKSHSVAMQKPAPITLYDYYATDKKATAFYQVDSKLCDICETEEDCRKCK